MDVIDLVEIYHKMVKGVIPVVYAVGSWLSSMYAKAGHAKPIEKATKSESKIGE